MKEIVLAAALLSSPDLPRDIDFALSDETAIHTYNFICDANIPDPKGAISKATEEHRRIYSERRFSEVMDYWIVKISKDGCGGARIEMRMRGFLEG